MAPEGTVQLQVTSFTTIHSLSEPGEQVTTGELMGGGGGSVIFIVILLLVPRMFVPAPSFAKTCDPPEIEIVADPFALARNVILPSDPLEPLYPGLGSPQLMVAVDAVYEGSCVKSVQTEPPLEILIG